jgi:hypothetical protein
MNCDACRQHLLMTLDPESPALDVAGHLAECLACRDWQHQLTHIEDNVRRLPVPASSPDAFVNKLLGGAPMSASPSGVPNGDANNPGASHPGAAAPALLPFPAPEAPVPSTAVPWAPKRRWLIIGGSVAAAGVLIAAGILLGNLVSGALRPQDNVAQNNDRPLADNAKAPEKPGPDGKDPGPRKTLVDVLMASNLELAEAETPRDRVEELAKIARALHGQTAKLVRAGATKEMERLAALYARVIREGVVPRAKSLPAKERQAALENIAGELARVGQEAEDMARTANPATVEPLRAISAAARAGDAQLRSLMGEGTE